MKHFDNCTPAEQLERWIQCRRVLKKLPVHERRKHWDMGTFGEKTQCGTVACAAGHCGLDPWFNKLGFILHESKYGFELCEVSSSGRLINTDIVLQKCFGYDGSYIFTDGSNRSVDQVLKEVDGYIEILKVIPILKKCIKNNQFLKRHNCDISDIVDF